MVHCIATLLTVILIVGGNGPTVRATTLQEQAPVTEQEKTEVQAFAKRFVERLLQTRDFRPLIPTFFLTNFTAIPKQDFYEKVAPELYAKLSKEERVRLFVAQENLGYFITLDVMTQSDSHTTSDPPPFEQILPAAVARKLSRSKLLEGTAKFTTRKELLSELSRLEPAILEARSFLRKKNLEQSTQFLATLGRFERDQHLGYRVRSSLVDEDLRREFGFARFEVGQKVFSVDTPILIQLILVKDAGKLRVVTVVPAE